MIVTGYILARAPRTKETLPDFHEWCRVTRHPRIFHGLTDCQRTPGKWGVTPTAIQRYMAGSLIQWAFHRVQEHPNQSSDEEVMVVRSWRPRMSQLAVAG